jgi:hypothetical protein
VREWICLTAAGGTPRLEYPAGRVGTTPANPHPPLAREGPGVGVYAQRCVCVCDLTRLSCHRDALV